MLAPCFPNLVWPVDITDTRGQMALFDRIITDRWPTTVIDLGNGPFDQFFKVMAEIGFEHEARQNQIQPVVLFIGDSAPFTAQTYAELRGSLEQTVFVPVHNEAAAFMLIARDFPASSPKYQTIRIPRLSPIVRGVIDRPGFSFAAYMAKQPGGRPRCTVGSVRFSANFASSNYSFWLRSSKRRCAAAAKIKVGQIY